MACRRHCVTTCPTCAAPACCRHHSAALLNGHAQVLEACGPPYSPYFAAALIRCTIAVTPTVCSESAADDGDTAAAAARGKTEAAAVLLST